MVTKLCINNTLKYVQKIVSIFCDAVEMIHEPLTLIHSNETGLLNARITISLILLVLCYFRCLCERNIVQMLFSPLVSWLTVNYLWFFMGLPHFLFFDLTILLFCSPLCFQCITLLSIPNFWANKLSFRVVHIIILG